MGLAVFEEESKRHILSLTASLIIFLPLISRANHSYKGNIVNSAQKQSAAQQVSTDFKKQSKDKTGSFFVQFGVGIPSGIDKELMGGQMQRLFTSEILPCYSSPKLRTLFPSGICSEVFLKKGLIVELKHFALSRAC